MPRVHLVWAILNIFRETRTNKNISIKLPLRLFDAVVTPTILFGLVSMPLTASDLNQLDAIQRRMLRSLVCMQDEPWRGRMIRMKKCVRPDDSCRPKLEISICKSSIFICHRGRWNMWLAKARN